MRAKELVTELFNRPYPVKIFADQAVAKDSQGNPIYVEFDRNPGWETVRVAFDRGNKGYHRYDLTGTGEEMRVFATVVAAIREWAAQHEPGMLYFSTENDEPTNRRRLYQRMVRELVPGTNYQQVSQQDADRITDERVSYWVDKLPTRFQGGTFFFLVRRDLLEPVTEATGAATPARQWIRKIYDEFYEHPFNPRHRVMTWGQGDDQQLAIFELSTVFSKPTTVDIKWFQAYPQRQGIGRRAMQILQQLAQEDGITLTLFPWNRGEISQSRLTKIYRGMGFRPTTRGSKDLTWQPQQQSVAEGSLNGSLSSMVAQDQAERNEYKQFVKSQAGGDWSKGAKLYAQLKKRPSDDIFGDKQRLNQFMKIKFDFDKFTDDDWNNYWLLAQHCDMNRNFQKQALSIIKKYQGPDSLHYKYLYDRISCAIIGTQKYGTQSLCDKDHQELSEGKYDSTTFRVPRRKLNVPALIKAGAIFITYPHGEQGWETDSKEAWAYSLISLYNVMSGGWTAEAKKYLKPQSYKHAEQSINSSAPNLGSNQLVYDGKYNQILWSIKKLGLADDVAFLDARGLAESLDKPYPITWISMLGGVYDAVAELADGSSLRIVFNEGGSDDWEVDFMRNGRHDVTGRGDAQRVFATVMKAIQQFIKKQDPWMLTFSADKEGYSDADKQSRVRLYDRLVKRYAQAWGYETRQQELSDKVVYELNRAGEGIDEGDVIRNKFAIKQAQKARTPYRRNPDIEIPQYDPSRGTVYHPSVAQGQPEAFSHFEAEAASPRVFRIIGITPQGRRVTVSTTGSAELARVLADAYNRGGFTDKDIQRVPLGDLDENFADGKNPGRKGLSRRVGIPKKATLGQLEKIAQSSSGERRRMAQWQLNMRRGRARKK